MYVASPLCSCDGTSTQDIDIQTEKSRKYPFAKIQSTAHACKIMPVSASANKGQLIVWHRVSYIITKMEVKSFWLDHRHWLHWKLSKWYFCLSDVAVGIDDIGFSCHSLLIRRSRTKNTEIRKYTRRISSITTLERDYQIANCEANMVTDEIGESDGPLRKC